MNKFGSGESSMFDISRKYSHGIQTGLYKKIIKPDSKREDAKLGKRLALAAAFGSTSALGTYGLTKLLKKINPKIFNGKVSPLILATSGLTGATSGYFYPDTKNAILNFHKDKNKELLDKALSKYRSSEKNVSNKVVDISESMNKHAGSANKTLSAVGKVISSGLKVGGKPTLGEKATRIAVKGSILGGLGYGAYKAYKRSTELESTGDYTTFLRNNILAGNIDPNEIPDQDKLKINELGMR